MNRKNDMYTIAIKFMMCVLSVIIIYETIAWFRNTSKIPLARKGSYVVFYEEMDSTMAITEIGATDEHIYFLYWPPGIVAVYDWNGDYQCSYAFYKGSNGTVDIRCDGELLYVHDHADYEFVFSGTENCGIYDSENRKHLIGWFKQIDEVSLVVKERSLYDLTGNYIMDLPGHIK